MKFIAAILVAMFAYFITLSDGLCDTHLAMGTYVEHDNIQQPVLIQNNNDYWYFKNTPLDISNGAYLNKMICRNKICIATSSTEIRPFHWPNHFRRPSFIISQDRGNHWNAVTKITNLPDMEDGIAPYFSCANVNCTSVGWYQKDGMTSPLVLVSHDSGITWNFLKILMLPKFKYASLSAITCEGEKCLASGVLKPLNEEEKLFFILSADGGKSWKYNDKINNLPKMQKKSINLIKCLNNNCIAAGIYNTDINKEHALLLRSNNTGESWEFIQELSELSNLSSIHIEDDFYSKDKLILVGGFQRNKGFLESLILISKDDGLTWNLIKKFSGAKDKKLGWLKSISCNGNTCVTGGNEYYQGDMNFDLTLLISKDNGQTWFLINSVKGLADIPNIDVIECSDKQYTAMGNFSDNLDYSHPIMIVSEDQGKSWIAEKNITNFPENIYEVKFSSSAKILDK